MQALERATAGFLGLLWAPSTSEAIQATGCQSTIWHDDMIVSGNQRPDFAQSAEFSGARTVNSDCCPGVAFSKMPRCCTCARFPHDYLHC